MSEHERLVGELLHQMQTSTMWTVLIHHAAASASGINVTDMQCVNLLQLQGPMTPGQIAERMSLTTGGAVTALIDRLEGAGLVRRRRDDRDRRRVIVEVVEGGPLAELSKRFGPVGEAYGKLMDGYTDEELRTVLRHLTRSNELAPEVLQRMKSVG